MKILEHLALQGIDSGVGGPHPRHSHLWCSMSRMSAMKSSLTIPTCVRKHILLDFVTLISRGIFPSYQCSLYLNDASTHIKWNCCHGIIQEKNRCWHIVKLAMWGSLLSFGHWAPHRLSIGHHKIQLAMVKRYITYQRIGISYWLFMIEQKCKASKQAV